MTAKELQQANIDRFERLLRSEIEPGRRADVERVLRDERRKDASAYPSTTPSPARVTPA